MSVTEYGITVGWGKLKSKQTNWIPRGQWLWQPIRYNPLLIVQCNKSNLMQLLGVDWILTDQCGNYPRSLYCHQWTLSQILQLTINSWLLNCDDMFLHIFGSTKNWCRPSHIKLVRPSSFAWRSIQLQDFLKSWVWNLPWITLWLIAAISKIYGSRWWLWGRIHLTLLTFPFPPALSQPLLQCRPSRGTAPFKFEKLLHV